MTSKEKLKVFIADDSDFIRERLPEMLSQLSGVEVIGQAEDGIEAVKSILTLSPDVVILDIRMPGKGGIEVLKEVKKHKPSTVIIILTNYPYPQYKKKCLEAGADFFLDKSVDFDQLPDILRKVSQAGGAKEVADI